MANEAKQILGAVKIVVVVAVVLVLLGFIQSQAPKDSATYGTIGNIIGAVVIMGGCAVLLIPDWRDAALSALQSLLGGGNAGA